MQYRSMGNTGLQVSVLGFGASPLGGVFGEVAEPEAVRCVRRALELGVNFIDVAPYYGLTKAETVLGRALRGVPRDAYLLATKVGRYGERDFDFSAERVVRSVDESLARLGVDYVDLIQCHDIEFGSLEQIVEVTLPALERVRAAGKARFIGITGLPLKFFREVAARAPVDTVLSYCRYSLNNTSLATLLPWLHERGIGVISASPLSMGLLTQDGPPAWHPAPPEVKDACARAAAHCRSRGVDIARLALQFSVAQEGIATTLVGMAHAEHVEKNAAWLAEPLDGELLAEVQAILAPIQGRAWATGRPENNDG